jgi:hypothetical protein
MNELRVHAQFQATLGDFVRIDRVGFDADVYLLNPVTRQDGLSTSSASVVRNALL